jgi:glucose-6-phosphate isomerase
MRISGQPSAAKAGEKVLVPPDWGHVMITPSSVQLVVANLLSHKCVQTYDGYLSRRVAALYLLKRKHLVRNPRHSEQLEIHMSETEAQPFIESESSLIRTFLEHPDRVNFLNQFSKHTCSIG